MIECVCREYQIKVLACFVKAALLLKLLGDDEEYEQVVVRIESLHFTHNKYLQETRKKTLGCMEDVENDKAVVPPRPISLTNRLCIVISSQK